MLSNKLPTSYSITISDNALAFKLKTANLSLDHEKLAKAICFLKYSSMKDQLWKIFTETKPKTAGAPSASPMHPVDIDITETSSTFPTLYARSSGAHQKDVVCRPKVTSSAQEPQLSPPPPPPLSQKLTFTKKVKVVVTLSIILAKDTSAVVKVAEKLHS